MIKKRNDTVNLHMPPSLGGPVRAVVRGSVPACKLRLLRR